MAFSFSIPQSAEKRIKLCAGTENAEKKLKFVAENLVCCLSERSF